ncbi:MAG TPA: OB-fold domain-containing protein [Candidatus Dormibacteraeota bacterium]|nr:OB-fold domain-containing protein [Candidatus Dormibacteraeota bacterium]
MVPYRRVCSACRSGGVREAAFGPSGTVNTSVELAVPTAGNPAPYWVAMVKLDDGPTVFARLAGPVANGAAVTMQADVESDGYWFGATSEESLHE